MCSYTFARILFSSFSTESTGVEDILDLRCTRKEKSHGIRSEKRVGQATGSPLPIQLFTRFLFKQLSFCLNSAEEHHLAEKFVILQ